MGRFTSHGEVVFEQDSKGVVVHPFWGQAKDSWPGEMKMAASNPGCGGCGQQKQAQAVPGLYPMDLEGMYQTALRTMLNVNEHMPYLRELASQCQHVTELSSWIDGALIALASGKPKKLVSVCHAPKPEWQLFHDKQLTMGEGTTFESRQAQPLAAEIEETDLLYICTIHTADALYAELTRYSPKARRYIVIHNTTVYGEKGDGGGPGLLPALRRFIREHPEWVVVRRVENNNGLFTISCHTDDKKNLPSMGRMALNFAKAYAGFKLHGSPLVSEAEMEGRLDVCQLCPMRVDERCSDCGCFLIEGPGGVPGRAAMKTMDCPYGWWPKI